MVAKNKKFIDDVIEHIEDDVNKIQVKPSMYIGSLGKTGALHLFKEIFNNAIDECTNSNSPGNEVDVVYDESENKISISDNGRGVPFDKMKLICTTIQSGSKFTRGGTGGASAGENGVGMTAVNALSDIFEISVHRGFERAVVRFENGVLIQDVTPKTTKSEDYGTTVTFVPSAKYLGACNIETEDLLSWIEKIVYLVPHTIKINVTVNRKGKEASIHKKYRNKNGLYDLCKSMVKKPLIDPPHLLNTLDVPSANPEVEPAFLGLETSFTFNESALDMQVNTFCNFVHTVENGVHLDAVRAALVAFFGKHTRDALSEKEAKKIEIIPNDITSGLVLTVYISTTLPPQFTGQNKEKVGNSELFKPVRELAYRAIENYFRTDPKELKKVTDYIKRNAKARLETTKVRNTIVRGDSANMDEHDIKFFHPANNKGKNDYRELLIVEGESALGGAHQACFNDFQAIFGLKGVPLNSFGKAIDKVLSNDEFKNLVQILRTGIGTQFDIKRLNYKKIILLTDSDVDGFRIFSSVCAFFMYHMPEIVTGGFLYKAVAPLYKLNNGGKQKPKYALSRLEYIKQFEQNIGDSIRLSDPATNVLYKASFMEDFLLTNRQYLELLQRTSSHYAVHPNVMEFIAIHGLEKDFKENLVKRFSELTIDADNILTGVYEGRYQILVIDKLFFKKIEPLRQLIFEANGGNVYYGVHEKAAKDYNYLGLMTIGQLMEMCQKYQPSIDRRYKGLGEVNHKELRETTLDPNKRTLYRLTVEDMEKDPKIQRELDRFRILHGDDAREERKELMRKYKINREDLDN